MVKLILPPIPRGPMFIDDTMSIEWQEFFRNLYERVGGYDGGIEDLLYLAVSNKDSGYGVRLDDLEALLLQTAQLADKDYDTQLDDLESLLFHLAQPGDKGFDARLDTLEDLPTIDDIVCHEGQVVCHNGEVVTS